MTTAEELSAALRQVAAHETHVATLTAVINEMRDHLEKAGVRMHAAEAQLRGVNADGHVKFTLGKEMMPDSFQRYGSREVLRLGVRVAGDSEHAGGILEWITRQENDVPFDEIALQ